MPKRWNIKSLKPNCSKDEIAEDLADFYNSISSEFRPLTADDTPRSLVTSEPIAHLLPHEVSARLKNCKEPRSMVDGDIFPRLVGDLHDLLAIPLTRIYNFALTNAEWPAQWKTEIVTVIPKSGNPQDYNDCRNLTCTPLFF